MTGPANILVVEDDPVCRITLTHLLEAEGHCVEGCETTEESMSPTAVPNLA